MKTLCSKINNFFKSYKQKSEIKRTTHLHDGSFIVKPKSNNIFYASIVIAVFLYFWFNIIQNYFNRVGFNFFIRNVPNFFTILGDMIAEFNIDYASNVVTPMVETIQISLIGTFIGAILSVPVAILASRNIMGAKNPVPNIVKSFLAVIRTFPTLVYALIFSYIFDYGTFIGVLATILFTFGIITKMLFEVIEGLDMGAFIAIEATGATKLEAFRAAIVPQILGRFYSIVLYTFEINLRASAILGFVNAGGIGRVLNDQMQLNKFGNVSVIVLSLLVVVLVVENLSQYLRRRLT